MFLHLISLSFTCTLSSYSDNSRRHSTPVPLPFSSTTRVSWYRNVSILDFIGAKDDGGDVDNWSCKTWKAAVKLLSPTNQHPSFCRPDAFSCRPANSVRELRENTVSIYEVKYNKVSFHKLIVRQHSRSTVLISPHVYFVHAKSGCCFLYCMHTCKRSKIGGCWGPAPLACGA